jgi:hypothetical protein
MPIKVACPSCKATVNAPDKVAGKKCSCPRCGGVLLVPHPRGWGATGAGDGITSSLAGLVEEADSRGRPKDYRRGLPGWAWLLFAAAGAGLLGGVVATALLRGAAP